MFPVRNYSTGEPLAHLFEEYKERVEKGEDPQKVLDDLEVFNYSSRILFLGHVELVDEIAKFKKS